MEEDFFADIERFRATPTLVGAPAALSPPRMPADRPRLRGEFLKGPIPLSWPSVAASLPGKAPLCTALAIMFESGRRKSDEVTLTSKILERFAVNRKAKYRALEALEGTGLITVQRQPRRNPLVRILEKGVQLPCIPQPRGGPTASA